MSSSSTSLNSEGAPDLPEVKAHPIFQASELSSIISPTESGDAMTRGSGSAILPGMVMLALKRMLSAGDCKERGIEGASDHPLASSLGAAQG